MYSCAKAIKLIVLKFIALISLLAAGIIIISHTSVIHAATVINDDFKDGYNSDLWSVRPNYLEPIPSSFGIVDNNLATWYLLDSKTTTLPNNSLVKIDMLINSTPSEVIFSCKANYKDDLNFYNDDDLRVYLRTDGTFMFESFIGGGGLGSDAYYWDNSAGIHHFELTCNDGLMTLKEDGILLQSFNIPYRDFTPSENVYFGYRLGDSEFTNYLLCDDSGCDNTQTPTPTPLPTLTPTPTPTPILTNKVIIIPGMGASWSYDLLSCSLNESDSWSLMPHFGEVYKPFVQELDRHGKTTLLYLYDWRKQIPDNASALNDFIESNTQPLEKVDIVGHSMGGLLARAYMEQFSNNNKIDHMITVGSPHQGSAFAYPAWAAGQIQVNLNKAIRFAIFFHTMWCSNKLRISDREIIQNTMPSIQNLLPVNEYLKDFRTAQMKPYSTLTYQNSWLSQSSFEWLSSGIKVGTITGVGFDTINGYVVRDQNRRELRNGDWADGKIIRKLFNDGDGTVNTTSALLENTEQRALNLDHAALMYSANGISIIKELLDINTETIHDTVLPDTALLVMSEADQFWVFDNSRHVATGRNGIAVITNPTKSYRTLLMPNRRGVTRSATAHILRDGSFRWRDYDHSGFIPQVITTEVYQ